MLNRLWLRHVVWVLALGVKPLTSQTPTRTADTSGVIAIRAGRLIDGRGGAPVSNAVILVRGERIQAVGVNLAIPAGARVIDLSNATVLPGLIDCHTHITGAPGQSGDQFRRSFVDAAIMTNRSRWRRWMCCRATRSHRTRKPSSSPTEIGRAHV